MSSDAGYMLIRVDLQGARAAAGEAATLRGSIAGVTEATTASNAAATAGATKATRLRNAWSLVGKAARIGALGIAGAVGILAVAGKKAVDATQALGLTAAGLRRNLGLTAQEGSRWASIASARQIAPTSLNMALKTLSANFKGAADGESTYVDLLKEIGIGHKDVDKSMKDFDFLVTSVADGLGKMEGGARRQAIASKLLGRGYQTVLPMFADGAKGLEEQLKWADKYNVTMGDQMVDKTMRLTQAQRESKVALQGFQIMLAKSFMPIMIDLHKEWQDFAEDITDPSLTTDQRLDMLRDKFQELAQLAGQAISKIIPVAVKNMTTNAPKVAGAFISGFIQADAWGRLIVGAWLASKFAFMLGRGGWFAKTGGASGRWFVAGLVTLGLVTIGPEIFKWAKELGEKFKDIGYEFGYAIGSKMRDVLNFFIEQFNSSIASDITGDIGLIEGHHLPPSAEAALQPGGAVLLPGGGTVEDITGIPSTPIDPGATTGGGGGGGGHHKKTAGDLPEGKTIPVDKLAAAMGGAGEYTAADVNMDGEKVGEVLFRRASAKAARR